MKKRVNMGDFFIRLRVLSRSVSPFSWAMCILICFLETCVYIITSHPSLVDQGNMHFYIQIQLPAYLLLTILLFLCVLIICLYLSMSLLHYTKRRIFRWIESQLLPISIILFFSLPILFLAMIVTIGMIGSFLGTSFELFDYIPTPSIWICSVFLFSGLILVGLCVLRGIRAVFFKFLVLIIFLMVLVGGGITMYEIVSEYLPQYYLTFPLDDPKGVYKINYDGDYWLTYYYEENRCREKENHGRKETVCDVFLVKKGNTSIIQSPLSLDMLLETPVHIKGTFNPTYPYISGEKKSHFLYQIM